MKGERRLHTAITAHQQSEGGKRRELRSSIGSANKHHRCSTVSAERQEGEEERTGGWQWRERRSRRSDKRGRRNGDERPQDATHLGRAKATSA